MIEAYRTQLVEFQIVSENAEKELFSIIRVFLF